VEKKLTNPLFSGISPVSQLDPVLLSGYGLLKVSLNQKLRQQGECVGGLNIFECLDNNFSSHQKIATALVYILRIAAASDISESEECVFFDLHMTKADVMQQGKALFGSGWEEYSGSPLLFYVRPRRAQVTVAFWKKPQGSVPDVCCLSSDSVILEFSAGNNHKIINHIISLILGELSGRDFCEDENVIIVSQKQQLQSVIPAKAETEPRQSPFPGVVSCSAIGVAVTAMA
jgi:hypothetical protein